MAITNQLITEINNVTTHEAPATRDTSELVESPWKNYQKFLFRFVFIYFAAQIIPLDIHYYQKVFEHSDSVLAAIFYTARYAPAMLGDVPQFTDWLVIAAFSLVGAYVWGVIDTQRTEYRTLLFWLRTLVRYRLAIALLAYGFIKFFPQQMPLPSLSNLNTNYGDLADWKVFSMSTGIVPGYQRFLGLVEIGAALLLFNRKTALIGAFIVLPFTGNVVLSNLAYEGGEYVYGALLVSFATFIVLLDAIVLYRFSAELSVTPVSYKISFSKSWQQNLALVAKAATIVIFVVVYGVAAYGSYRDGGYQYPIAKGIDGVSGIFNVSEFIIDGDTIPPSRVNELRWRDVVFEEWATLSIRSNQPFAVASALTEEIHLNDSQRNYEFAGNGGRHFYRYTYDPASSILKLSGVHGDGDQYEFKITFNGSLLHLEGQNTQGQILHVTLEKIDKKYLLHEAEKNGRRRGLKL